MTYFQKKNIAPTVHQDFRNFSCVAPTGLGILDGNPERNTKITILRSFYKGVVNGTQASPETIQGSKLANTIKYISNIYTQTSI